MGEGTRPSPAKGPGSRGYALGLLIVVALFNYIDRQSLAILQVPIKRDLGLSDTELGALTGLAFAFLYSTLALPIARLADRAPRKWIISVALGIWSLMTAASGLATGFMTLVVFRMGVALGEAGCVPASHALISDYFPPGRRAKAIAIWGLSLPIGIMLGFASGGWLSAFFGWRRAFLVLGAAGLCLVPLVLLTLREPARGATDSSHAEPAPSFRVAVAALWRLKAFRHATAGAALLVYAMQAMLSWNAPFYSRVFGLSLGDLATYLALSTGIGGAVGIYVAGAFADRLGRRDPRWYMRVPALAALCLVPLMLVQYLTADLRLSLAAGVAAAIAVNAYMPPVIATAQSLVPAGMRAFTSSVLVLVVNIIGLGLGPVVTGAISDRLISDYGMAAESLRYAIASAALFALWAAYHFNRSALFLPNELRVSAANAAEAAQVVSRRGVGR